MKKILFVCLGNICRSPGAEAILKTKVREAGEENDFYIDSAGIYGGHSGSLPDERMCLHANKRGYILDSRARQFYPSADFAEFNLIIGMDDQNIRDLKSLAIDKSEECKIYKMTDFCQKYKNYNSVPDPYYSGAEGFELVLDLLEDAVEGLFSYLHKDNL